jgi:hypothetical protein
VLRRRLPWIGAVVALTLGLGLSLTYSWLIDPLVYYDSDPVDLNPALQQDYLALIALSYHLTGDLARAQARLATLGEAGTSAAVAALADQQYQAGGNAETVRALALLAYALGAQSEAVAAYLPTATPTITPTPLPTTPPTATPTPTATATSTPEALPTPDVRPPYRVAEHFQVCDDPDAAGLIQVIVQDAEGRGLPNVEVQVSWEGERNRFFTGLKPEIDPGYADFQMTPGQLYAVVVWGAQVGDLSTEGCPSGLAGWRLIFQRRE